MIGNTLRNTKKSTKKSLLMAFCLLVCGVSQAQINPNNNTPIGGLPDHMKTSNPFETTDETADSTQTKEKKAKIRKPLESYFFSDSVRNHNLFIWNVNTYKNDITLIDVDTIQNSFQHDYPFRYGTMGDATLANLGGPTISLDAFKRPEYRNFSFVQAFDIYLKNPQNVRFFNCKTPFSQLSYFESGSKQKAESQLRVTHSQNISPSSSFNIDYRVVSDKGRYAKQKATDKNLSLAFAHTGKRYTVHAGYIYNMGDVRNNGGVQTITDVMDTVYDDPVNIPVRLQDSKTKFKGNTFYTVQSYGITLSKEDSMDFSIADKSTIFVGHAFEYTRYHREYTDTKAGSTTELNGDFYDNWYLDPNATYDSICETLIDNRVFMQFQPYSRDGIIGLIDAGVGYAFHKFYRFDLDQYLYNTKGENKNSLYLYGALRGSYKKYFDWSADARYYMLGYRNQDFSVNGKIDLKAFIKGRPITLSGSVLLDAQTPGYWTQSFISNHYVWSNSFKQEFETRIDASLKIPHIQMEVGVTQSLMTNKVYYDEVSLPTQHSEVVSVTGGYLRKDFALGGLHLNHRVLLQWSSAQEVVPVPLASAYLSYYYEFNIVKNVLRVQLGLDGYYNTKYYGFAYNPALAQFYNQRERELGNYPLVDVFLTAKWKRMRIILKYQHANENLFGERDYFSVLHYPQNRGMFKIGISWGFYD